MGPDLLTRPTLSEQDSNVDPPPESEASVQARRERASRQRGVQGLLIRVAADDAVSAGATAVGRGIAAKLGYEDLVFPEDSPGSTIGRTADLRDRAMIVLPASNQGTATRPAFAGRAHQIITATRHPVLLVPTSASWPIRRCVAATDFSRPSLAGARAALELLEPPAELRLAFVNTPEDGGEVSPHEAPRHVRLLLDALPHTLESPPGVEVDSVLLAGGVLSALVSFAERWPADLLAIGRHGRSSSTGLLMAPLGPLVRGVLAGSPCSVLVASAG